MSKTRKLLSVAVAVAMLLSVLAVGVFAGIGYSDDTDAAHTQVWTLSTPVDNEDGTYSVDVSLTTTYATGAIEFMIENTDTAVAELSDAVAGAALPFDADVTFSYTTGKVMIVPVTSGKTFLPGEAIDGVIATLTFAYAGEGSATINIAEDAKSTTNVGGTLIAAYAENLLDGSVKVGQAATFEDNSQVIGTAAAEPADLAVKSAYASSGIIIDKNKTLDGKYAGVVYGFDFAGSKVTSDFYTERLEATNGGSITVVKTPYVARPASYGTGATVEVYNADGTLSKTYVIIVLGDLSGNGAADASDLSAIFNDVNGEKITDPVKVLAANIIVSGRTASLKAKSLYEIAADDLSLIFEAVNGDATIDQVALAAAHATYTTYYV